MGVLRFLEFSLRAFIIFRDRVTYAKRCMAALRFAGLETVVVDHGSTWGLARAWLATCMDGGTTVLKRGSNHPRSLWGDDRFRQLCGGDRYLVTDCDVVPSADCPDDWLANLERLLNTYPHVGKAGFGLRIDDIPDGYQWHDKVLSHEQQFWQNQVEPGVYAAAIDTTLALYRPLSAGGFVIDGSLRTGVPYLAQHLAWYEDLDNLSPELQYYAEHVDPGISHWIRKDKSNWGPS